MEGGGRIIPLRNAIECLGQRFSAMKKRFFQLEQELPLATTFRRAVMQKQACFFYQSALSFVNIRTFDGVY